MSRRWRLRVVVYPLLAAVLAAAAWYIYRDSARTREPQVVYATTPPDAVEKMLALAAVTKDDVVYDLGCGDGRIVIAAAKVYGCRAVGVELQPHLVELARRNAADAGVGHLVEIRHGDIFEADFRDATVVAIYLLPDLNLRLLPEFNRLRQGARVVSYAFDMPGVPAKETVRWESGDKLRTIYLWVTPIPTP
jgi:SAM-dependent methyltransferase